MEIGFFGAFSVAKQMLSPEAEEIQLRRDPDRQRLRFASRAEVLRCELLL